MTIENRHPDYEKTVKRITSNLRKFGYFDLTQEEVLASYDKAMAGEDPVGIIDMMTKGQLEQNNLLPDFPEVDESLVDEPGLRVEE